jgi:hypothetical protein
MGALAKPLGMALDPLNITGVNDEPTQHSRPRLPAEPTMGQIAGQPDEPPRGFSQMLTGDVRGFGGFRPAPPPPQWTYQAGKGPAWSTPKRVGETNDFTMEANLPGSEGFNGFKGNRF